MDDTTPEEPERNEESSGDYRLRFRYVLWAQASQGFRVPALLKRIAPIARDSTASASDSRSPELESSFAADGATDRRGHR